ncbi:hypothetical protein CAOG_01250 [Capsaspora owczarzaki ATCC 30864]|uniref:Uncharacterized protein n=1 Tax=Capsaspora owczarzaki (strain ATCC 30864) TaxID=595528 RepID=A0A0D2X0X7_CAPO3|nr:hypothetical protein CAOG_01250 [Capsaspora owczarzaki ATCC 30864]KJE89829.1 hypothetical protein CAOG_001250 [Capsaspora owczarzaki ATCC 30864]|eukprot:XP_004349770.2 hypothetical protein CAOG_01250 [Capsaspora owczarzaki ATCC 30864]
MFGCLASGRLVQTEPVAVDPARVVFTIDDADKINHLVVFLLGHIPFDEGFGGAVYFGWPSAEGPVWQYLGFISNLKPSAIFRVSKTRPTQSEAAAPFASMYQNAAPMGGFQQNFGGSMMDSEQAQYPAYMYDASSIQAQVGISIEPLDDIAQQTPLADEASQAGGMIGFTQAMLANFFNYAMSFSTPTPKYNEEYVPTSVVKQWYESFERKLALNPNFWKQ